jgi:hypothetical protein
MIPSFIFIHSFHGTHYCGSIIASFIPIMIDEQTASIDSYRFIMFMLYVSGMCYDDIPHQSILLDLECQNLLQMRYRCVEHFDDSIWHQ